MRFGRLTVLEATGKTQSRYQVWLCRCDCGKETEASTKRLQRVPDISCGCAKKNGLYPAPASGDLTGRRYGMLTVIRPYPAAEQKKTIWLCRCDCGNECYVSSNALFYGNRKSCGCLHRKPHAVHETDLTGRIFGRLTAISKTDLLSRSNSAIWRCRCECGKEICTSADSLLQGYCRSCGCIRQELQKNLHNTMTFVEDTCVDMLEKRKSRSDNKSGFRGVSKASNGKWMVSIGMQNKRYYIGLFENFDDAVRARLRIEDGLHGGFVKAYREWQSKADAEKAWADENPFYFNVKKEGQDFFIDSVFGSTTVNAV